MVIYTVAFYTIYLIACIQLLLLSVQHIADRIILHKKWPLSITKNRVAFESYPKNKWRCRNNFGYFDDKMCRWKSFSSKIFPTKLFWLRDSDTPENNSVTYKTWDNNKPFFLSLLNKLIIKKYISSSHKNYRIIPILVTKGRHCTFAHLKYV